MITRWINLLFDANHRISRKGYANLARKKITNTKPQKIGCLNFRGCFEPRLNLFLCFIYIIRLDVSITFVQG